MKLVNQGFVRVKQKSIWEHIEKCARICYKSEGLVKEGSAKPMVRRLYDAGHTAMLEHGAVYLLLKRQSKKSNHRFEYLDMLNRFREDPYTIVNVDDSKDAYVSTNLRVICEKAPELFGYMMNNDDMDLQFSNYPFIYSFAQPVRDLHVARHTYIITSDRGVLGETTRHRKASFAAESSRYVNYLKRGIAFINPEKWLKKKWNVLYFKIAYNVSEFCYNRLIKSGESKDLARNVLCMGLKTDFAFTIFESDLEHFFNLRCSHHAHPQIREIALNMMDEVYAS